MKAAVYLRQSLDHHLDGLAVDRQRTDCLALCAQRGWTPTQYVDNSISATSTKPRPAYTQMLADIEAGKVQAVVAWDLDRLHRGPAELESFIDLADRHRLALATVGGDADLSTDNGRLFARIKGAVARAEIERKSVRQKRAAQQQAQAGKAWGRRRPFGYEKCGVVVNEFEADLIRHAYADFLAGSTITSIAEKWNANGVTSVLGGRWYQSTVHGVLRNPRNAGLRAYHGEVVGLAEWEAIVPEETYRAALAKLTDPARRTGGGGAMRHLLTGIVHCGQCGATVTGGSRPLRRGATERVRTYKCVKFHVSCNATDVESIVVGAVAARLARPDARELLVDHDRPDSTGLREEAATVRARLDSLAVDFADGALTASQLRTATERMRARLAELETLMAHTDRAPVLVGLVGADDVRAVWDGLPLFRQRSVIDLLMSITVLPAGRGGPFNPERVQINWRQ